VVYNVVIVIKELFYLIFSIPGPIFPYLNLIKELLLDSFILAVVAYAVTMSMGLILAEGEDYELDANQELLAHVSWNNNIFFYSSFLLFEIHGKICVCYKLRCKISHQRCKFYDDAI
jgi:Sulfate permease family